MLCPAAVLCERDFAWGGIEMNIATVAPIWQRRNAPNSIYPLRGADGLTWAERKAKQEQAQ
jgi:hypothetical protein